MRSRILLWSLIVTVLTACGGKDNHPPTAQSQSLTGPEDTPITGTLQGTDPDNDPLTYSVASQASHGQVTVQASGAFQYQPTANFNGADSFEFQVTDSSGAAARATVALTVTPVNDAPTIPAATFKGVQNSNITGIVSGNDVDGDPMVFAIVSNPTHGTLVSFDSQGNFTYQPSPDYHGSDSFSASVTDPSGATTSGVLTLRVDGPPQASNDIISVPSGNPLVVDVLANDTDPEGDALTVQILAAPTAGAASVTADNRVSLNLPAGFRGFARFSYRATDPSGLSSTATAVLFVGTPAARVAWIGDEFKPGTTNVAVSDFIAPWAADAPLPVGDTLNPYSVLYRTESDKPAVGFSTTSGAAWWAKLDEPGSAQLVAPGSAYIADIDVHSKLVLYTSGYLLSLAALDGSAGYGVLNSPNYCGGAFGPAGTDVFLGCTGPTNSFPLPTNYWLQVAAPGVLTQLAPPIQSSGGPNAPVITPDGSAIVYNATRTDSAGTFHALFLVKLSAPGQEVQISPRFTTLNEGADYVRFTPDGKKLLYSGFSTSTVGFCDLYVYDLGNGGSPAKVNGPHDSASCPLEYDFSPDSQRVVYIFPPVGQPTQDALYETALSTPGVVNTIFAGGLGYYGNVQYDETGTNIIYVGTLAPATTSSPTLYEWHRSDNSVVQLSPAGDVVGSYAHNADWSIIAYTAKRSGSFVYDQRVLNRAIPGQAVQLSNPAATTGVLIYTSYASAYFVTK